MARQPRQQTIVNNVKNNGTTLPKDLTEAAIKLTDIERSPSAGAGPGSNPDSKINNAVISKASVKSYNFPLDLPRYHFGIIETQASNPSASGITLDPIKQYRLPLPMPLVDNFSVMYDSNFSYNSLENLITSTLGPITTAVQAAAGIRFNSYKGVTLSQPEFRRIQFQWKLSPRNAAEAEDIQQIIYGLRIGMTPATSTGKLTFIFPRIYLLYFYPNTKYLYKFKPVVLENISVDYAGGNPVPAFYQTANYEDTPPESVLITTTWLELEYWTQKDYKGTNQMPTSSEFDSWNFYKLDKMDPDI